jgi:hypothetical protein
LVDYEVVGKDGQVMALLKSALSIYIYIFWYSICTMLSLPYQRDLGGAAHLDACDT